MRLNRNSCKNKEVNYSTSNNLENLYLKKVQQNGLELEHIKEQTEAICIEAVKNTGIAIIFVNNKTEKICMEAINSNPATIQFIENQTPEMAKFVLNKNPKLLHYINDNLKKELIYSGYIEYKSLTIDNINIIEAFKIKSKDKWIYYTEYQRCITKEDVLNELYSLFKNNYNSPKFLSSVNFINSIDN